MKFSVVFIFVMVISTISSLPAPPQKHLQQVLERLDDHGILINVEKSLFGVTSRNCSRGLIREDDAMDLQLCS